MTYVRFGFFSSLALTAVLISVPANAQSFNCRYAKTADEVLICQTPRLSALDERMSSIFFRLRSNLHGRERSRLEADQAEWLHERRACGRDVSCIESAYRRRIRELLAY